MVDTTFKAISALAPHKFPGTPKPQACCDCFKSCSACHNQHDLDMAKKFNTLQNWLSLQVKQLEMQKRRHLQCTESKERDSSLPVRKSIKLHMTKSFKKSLNCTELRLSKALLEVIDSQATAYLWVFGNQILQLKHMTSYDNQSFQFIAEGLEVQESKCPERQDDHSNLDFYYFFRRNNSTDLSAHLPVSLQCLCFY